jgi:hypothetical protein
VRVWARSAAGEPPGRRPQPGAGRVRRALVACSGGSGALGGRPARGGAERADELSDAPGLGGAGSQHVAYAGDAQARGAERRHPRRRVGSGLARGAERLDGALAVARARPGQGPVRRARVGTALEVAVVVATLARSSPSAGRRTARPRGRPRARERARERAPSRRARRVPARGSPGGAVPARAARHPGASPGARAPPRSMHPPPTPPRISRPQRRARARSSVGWRSGAVEPGA